MSAQPDPVTAYARRVVAGEVPAGKYHRLACQRHLDDLARQGTPEFPFEFIWAEADRFLRFASKFRHYKGKRWAGQPFVPSDNQVFRLGCVFGWRRTSDGRRRFTTAYNELPRKSGKTFEAAIVGLYTTFFEGEPGAEGACIATKRQQARRVFDDMRKLVQSSALKKRIAVQVGKLEMAATDSRFEPFGADADSADGWNPHAIITDEYHAHKTNDLVDVMESATGARDNPMHYQITTAGDDLESPCGRQHDYICKILDGVLDDEATRAVFGFIASADPGDDWQAEETWRKANPQYGISVLPEDMLKRALEAKNIPSKAAEFRQKRLNEWINATTLCLSVDGWRDGQTSWLPEEMAHESCYIGIDLASLLDLCCLSIVFPPAGTRTAWRIIQHIWTPADTLVDRAHRDRAPYGIWRDKGWLIASPGQRIDHQLLRPVLRAAREQFNVERIGFDPWHADTLIDQLVNEDGFKEEQVLAVPQTFAGMSGACLLMQAEIASGNVDARGCPVTAWSVSNVVANRDGKDNLMFAKGKSRGRIDPVIAPTIGMALWKRFAPVVKQRPRRIPKIWTHDGWVPALPAEDGDARV